MLQWLPGKHEQMIIVRASGSRTKFDCQLSRTNRSSVRPSKEKLEEWAMTD